MLLLPFSLLPAILGASLHSEVKQFEVNPLKVARHYAQLKPELELQKELLNEIISRDYQKAGLEGNEMLCSLLKPFIDQSWNEARLDNLSNPHFYGDNEMLDVAGAKLLNECWHAPLARLIWRKAFRPNWIVEKSLELGDL